MSIVKKLTTIANNMQSVYDAGYEKGKSEGGDNWEDTFWNVYQENGNRSVYNNAFSGKGWTTETFKPKYNIVPITPTQMFSSSSLLGIDLVEHLKNIKKELDFSKCTTFIELFAYTGVARVGVIDTRSCSNLGTIFAYSYNNLKTIDLLILKDDGSQIFSNNSFIQATGLADITIQGVIGQTINLQWSGKLSKASITNIINALSTTTSDLSVTISKTAKEAVFTPDEWSALEATKPNWTISLS